MFKLIILLLSVIVFYSIFKKIYIKYHKLNLNGNIKFIMSETDREYINLNSKKVLLSDVKSGIFYTTSKWTTKNNNYIHDKILDRYYIIDKNYYYQLNDNCEITINNNLFVILI